MKSLIQPRGKLKFSDFFKAEDILGRMTCSNKKDAQNQLIEFLCERNNIYRKNLVQRRIAERENLQSTALGHGVAFPHARLEIKTPVQMVMGRLREGIDYNAIDKQPVRLIFMAVWRPDFPGLFSQIFGGLIEFLRVPAFREELMNAEDATGIHRLITEAEIKVSYQNEKINKAAHLLNLQELELRKRNTSYGNTRSIARKIKLLRSEIDIEILNRFDRLLQKTGLAIVEVTQGSCQNCHMKLSSGTRAILKRGKDIILCENCGHFIIDSE